MLSDESSTAGDRMCVGAEELMNQLDPQQKNGGMEASNRTENKSMSNFATFPWLHGILRKCREILGTRKLNSLNGLLIAIVKELSCSIEDCYSRPNRALRLRNVVSEMLVYIDMIYQDVKAEGGESGDNVTYLNVMSDLLAIYLDLEIKASKFLQTFRQRICCCWHLQWKTDDCEGPTDERGLFSLKKTGQFMTTALYTHLGESEDHILDTILKAKLMTKSVAELCAPVVHKILNHSSCFIGDENSCVRYLLAFKLLHKLTKKGDRHIVTNMARKRLDPAPEVEINVRRSKIFPMQLRKNEPLTDFIMNANFDFIKAKREFLKISSISGSLSDFYSERQSNYDGLRNNLLKNNRKEGPPRENSSNNDPCSYRISYCNSYKPSSEDDVEFLGVHAKVDKKPVEIITLDSDGEEVAAPKEGKPDEVEAVTAIASEARETDEKIDSEIGIFDGRLEQVVPREGGNSGPGTNATNEKPKESRLTIKSEKEDKKAIKPEMVEREKVCADFDNKERKKKKRKITGDVKKCVPMEELPSITKVPETNEQTGREFAPVVKHNNNKDIQQKENTKPESTTKVTDKISSKDLVITSDHLEKLINATAKKVNYENVAKSYKIIKSNHLKPTCEQSSLSNKTNDSHPFKSGKGGTAPGSPGLGVSDARTFADESGPAPAKAPKKSAAEPPPAAKPKPKEATRSNAKTLSANQAQKTRNAKKLKTNSKTVIKTDINMKSILKHIDPGLIPQFASEVVKDNKRKYAEVFVQKAQESKVVVFANASDSIPGNPGVNRLPTEPCSNPQADATEGRAVTLFTVVPASNQLPSTHSKEHAVAKSASPCGYAQLEPQPRTAQANESSRIPKIAFDVCPTVTPKSADKGESRDEEFGRGSATGGSNECDPLARKGIQSEPEGKTTGDDPVGRSLEGDNEYGYHNQSMDTTMEVGLEFTGFTASSKSTPAVPQDVIISQPSPSSLKDVTEMRDFVEPWEGPREYLPNDEEYFKRGLPDPQNLFSEEDLFTYFSMLTDSDSGMKSCCRLDEVDLDILDDKRFCDEELNDALLESAFNETITEESFRRLMECEPPSPGTNEELSESGKESPGFSSEPKKNFITGRLRYRRDDGCTCIREPLRNWVCPRCSYRRVWLSYNSYMLRLRAVKQQELRRLHEADRLKSQDDELLRRIEESLKRNASEVEDLRKSYACLPLKKRIGKFRMIEREFASPGPAATPGKFPSYPISPMMSIAELQKSEALTRAADKKLPSVKGDGPSLKEFQPTRYQPNGSGALAAVQETAVLARINSQVKQSEAVRKMPKSPSSSSETENSQPRLSSGGDSRDTSPGESQPSNQQTKRAESKPKNEKVYSLRERKPRKKRKNEIRNVR